MNCQTEWCLSVPTDTRRFFTKEEKTEMLKEYLAALQNETQGVTERIAELERA